MKRLFTITTILLSPALMADTGLSVDLTGRYQERTSTEFNLPTSYGEGIQTHTQSQADGSKTFGSGRALGEFTINYKFKDNLTASASYSYNNSEDSLYKNVNGLGYYWRLDGGDEPHNNYIANWIDNTAETQKTIDNEVKLFFQIDNYKKNRFSMQTRLGVDFFYDKKDYKYLVNGRMYGPSETPYNQMGSQHINTFYYGPFYGVHLEAQAAKRLSFFIDADAYLLQAETNLKANQELNYSLIGEEKQELTNYTITDRYKLEAGVKIDIGEPTLRIFAGLDAWGYVAQVDNPDKAGAQGLHIEERTSARKYLGASINIPIN